MASEHPGQERGPVIRALLFTCGYDHQTPLARSRENDQIVRRLVTAALAASNDILRAIESEYRRLKVPPASREHPFPPQDVQDTLTELHRLARLVTGLIGTVDSMESAPADHQAKRLGLDTDWSTKSMAADVELVGAAQRLRDTLKAIDASISVSANLTGELKPLLDDVARCATARRDLNAP